MMTNGSKNQKKKKKFLMHFETAATISDLSDGLQDTLLLRFLFSRLSLPDSIFFKNSLDC